MFQDDPEVLCSALGLCVTQQEALAKAQLMSNEIPKMDLTQRVNPLLLNIPQLLYPKENAKKETATGVGTLGLACCMKVLGLVWLTTANRGVSLQESDTVCDDCVKFLTDAQDEARKNASFINALIEQIETQCDLLGPGLSDMVRLFN